MSAAASAAGSAPAAADVLAALRSLPGLAVQGVAAVRGAAAEQPDALAPYGIGGRLPAALALPETPEQVAALLALAHGQGWGVVPWGAGRDMAAGRAPLRYHVALSLARLAQVAEHDAENLTLTAQAGLPLAEANRRVRGAHQCVPLGYDGDARTLGGLIAVNRPVARRLLYGDIRDQLLGLRVAMPDGRLVRFGRKVVKNVAGYDMSRLFTGSAGMLGVIVEVTLKLSALPDEAALAVARFGTAGAALAAAGELYRSALAPAQIVLLDGAGARACLDPGAPDTDGLCWLAVGFEGRGAGVRRQTRDALAALARHGGADGRVLPPWTAAANAWMDAPAPQRGGEPRSGDESRSSGPPRIRNEPRGDGEPPGGLLLRAGSAPASLGKWAETLRRQAGELGMTAALVADYGGGWLRCGWTPGARQPSARQPDPERLAGTLLGLRAGLEAERGYLALERAPAAAMERIGPWGSLGGETAVMGVLRRQMDPREILAPGRFL
jgi:glycolate oxidase FAD binding subunit